MYELNFSGKSIPGTQEIFLDDKQNYHLQEDILLEASKVVDQVRDKILEAKQNGFPVVLILPDNGVMAVCIFQAVRGLLGNRLPFVRGWNTEDVDTESIRESFRESL